MNMVYNPPVFGVNTTEQIIDVVNKQGNLTFVRPFDTGLSQYTGAMMLNHTKQYRIRFNLGIYDNPNSTST